jgi:hypothetical protein
MPTKVPTYVLPTYYYLPIIYQSYLFIYLPTYIKFIYLPTYYLPTYLSIYLIRYLLTYLWIEIPMLLCTLTKNFMDTC